MRNRQRLSTSGSGEGEIPCGPRHVGQRAHTARTTVDIHRERRPWQFARVSHRCCLSEQSPIDESRRCLRARLHRHANIIPVQSIARDEVRVRQRIRFRSSTDSFQLIE